MEYWTKGSDSIMDMNFHETQLSGDIPVYILINMATFDVYALGPVRLNQHQNLHKSCCHYRWLAMRLDLLAVIVSLSVSMVLSEGFKIAAFNVQIFGKTKAGKPEVMESLVKVRMFSFLSLFEVIYQISQYTYMWYWHTLMRMMFFNKSLYSPTQMRLMRHCIVSLCLI